MPHLLTARVSAVVGDNARETYPTLLCLITYSNMSPPAAYSMTMAKCRGVRKTSWNRTMFGCTTHSLWFKISRSTLLFTPGPRSRNLIATCIIDCNTVSSTTPTIKGLTKRSSQPALPFDRVGGRPQSLCKTAPVHQSPLHARQCCGGGDLATNDGAQLACHGPRPITAGLENMDNGEWRILTMVILHDNGDPVLSNWELATLRQSRKAPQQPWRLTRDTKPDALRMDKSKS